MTAGARLLLDCVRMGALMEQIIREVVAPESLNDADVWIIVVLSGRFDTPSAEGPVPMSAAAIAARLGFARGRVSMRIAGLVRKRLVRAAQKVGSRDGRTRVYVLSQTGNEQATRFHRALAQLEQEIRYAAGIKVNAHAVDPQRVALSLWSLALWRGDEPLGLDRRRTAGMSRGRKKT